MKHKIKDYSLHIILCAGLFLVANWRSVSADIYIPYQDDYTIEVGNGDYIFVMLSIEGNVDDFPTVKDPAIRNQYSQSGLYHVNHLEKPLWTVDWWASRITLSEDGRYLIRWGSSHYYRGQFNKIAVAFYEEGVLLERYAVSNIVRNPYSLPYSIQLYSWLTDSRFNNEELTLMVETKNSETYLFDITTGEILEQSHWHFGPFDRYIWLSMLMIIVLGFILVRKRRGCPPDTMT